MLKFLQTLALAVVIALGGTDFAKAEHTAIVGSTFTAVGTSSSLRLTTKGDTATIYVNGVYDAVLDLEREVGSPGSGAYQRVLSDIAPTANTQYRVSWVAETNNVTIRLRLRTFTSGTVVYVMFDGRLSIPSFPYTTHVDYFDDFIGADVATTGDTSWGVNEYAYFIETQGTPADVLATAEEGAMVMTSGTAGTITQDVTAISGPVVADQAALVSDGSNWVEWRVESSIITGQSYGFGLSDVVAIATTIALFVADTNVVTDTGSTNDIALMFSTDADAGNFWIAVSTNAGNVGNNDDEFACSQAHAVDNYERLGILIEATGDAFFYVDGTLCAAEALAVATTARLLPYGWATSATDTTTGGAVITIDYIDFKMARPTVSK